MLQYAFLQGSFQLTKEAFETGQRMTVLNVLGTSTAVHVACTVHAMLAGMGLYFCANMQLLGVSVADVGVLKQLT